MCVYMHSKMATRMFIKILTVARKQKLPSFIHSPSYFYMLQNFLNNVLLFIQY